MPSVLFGATTTARLVFTPISSALGAVTNGAGSIAFLFLAPTLDCDLGGLMVGATGNRHTMGRAGHIAFDDDSAALVAPLNGDTDSNWYIYVVDWGATIGTERFHSKNLTAGTAWVHQDSTANGVAAFAGPGTSGWWHIGDCGDSTVANGLQIALCAAWNVRLGDTNAAALYTNNKTSDWYSNAAGHPIFLSETTTLTPSDLIAGSTFSGANSVTTGMSVGGEPDGGWTFDGLGASQTVLPDADLATTGWSTAPLFSKVNDASDATVITATLA